MISYVLYSRKRKSRWWRYRTLKDALLGAQREPAGSRNEFQALARAFQRLGYGRVPVDLEPFWRELVSLGSGRTLSLRAEDVDRLETVATELKPELLSSLCWLDLYRLCLGIGFFQPGRTLREHGFSRMTLDARQRGADLEQLMGGCYAQVEQGHHQSARALLQRMGQQGCPEERLAQASWFVEVLAGNQPRDDFGYPGYAAPDDLEFGRFIRGKRIALVGPAPNKLIQGPEIDCHEVVVKFGYRGGMRGRDPEAQGERLDVSYYNNTQAEVLAKSDYDQVFSSIQWAVCQNRKGRSRFPEDYPGLRLLGSLQWLLPDTHFNAGPNAIIDLLRFSPATIRVFNTDLMLSSGRFAGYTQPGAKPIDYTRSFIKTHDPILQYQIMQGLWKAGHMRGDPRFEEVMGMGLRVYLEYLQQAYGANKQALL